MAAQVTAGTTRRTEVSGIAPSRETPVTEGKWHVTWMEPEPMHSIENAETAESALTLPKRLPTVRVEFKVHP